MKRILLKTFILIITMVLLGSVIVNAKDDDVDTTTEAATGSIEELNGAIKSSDGGIDGTEGKDAIVKIVSTVLRLVRIAGVGVAVAVLMHISVKYIIASAGDRADIKKYAWNYVVGALVLFGASGIVSIAQKFVEDAFGESVVGGA